MMPAPIIGAIVGLGISLVALVAGLLIREFLRGVREVWGMEKSNDE
jgi:hypothetical protein